MKRTAAIFLAAALLTGCGSGESVSEAESREAVTAAGTSALTVSAETAGTVMTYAEEVTSEQGETPSEGSGAVTEDSAPAGSSASETKQSTVTSAPAGTVTSAESITRTGGTSSSKKETTVSVTERETYSETGSRVSETEKNSGQSVSEAPKETEPEVSASVSEAPKKTPLQEKADRISEASHAEKGKLSSAADLALTDLGGGKYSFNYDGKTFSAAYTADNWHIPNSYRITSFEDMVTICGALKELHPIHGKDMVSYREPEDMAYEWLQHNIAYEIIPEGFPGKSNARDVDIDPKDQGRDVFDLMLSRLK